MIFCALALLAACAAIAAAEAALLDPATLPSARVLAAMAKDYDHSFVAFARSQSASTRQALLGLPFSATQQAAFEALTHQSVAAQKNIEAADTMPFEIYRQQYVSLERLDVPSREAAVAL